MIYHFLTSMRDLFVRNVMTLILMKRYIKDIKIIHLRVRILLLYLGISKQLKFEKYICSSSSRPSQLSSSLRRQVWSAVNRLETISPKLLVMFDAHLGQKCYSKIFKLATNIFCPTQDRTQYLLASVTMLLPTELRHLQKF